LPSSGEPNGCAKPPFFSFYWRKTLDDLSKNDRLVIGTGISRDATDWVSPSALRSIIERFPSLLEEAHCRIRGRRAEASIKSPDRLGLRRVALWQLLQ